MKRVIRHLMRELGILKRCKKKSIQSFNRAGISEETHKVHLENIDPLIDEFDKAIKVLKDVK